MPSNTLQAEFIILQSRLNTKLIKRVEGQLSIHGISFTEYMILRFLSEAPHNTMRRIELGVPGTYPKPVARTAEDLSLLGLRSIIGFYSTRFYVSAKPTPLF